MILEMDIDISDKKRAEEALREANERLEAKVEERTREFSRSEAKFHGVFDSIQYPVTLIKLVHDGEGDIIERELIDANPAAIKELRADPKEKIIGKRGSEPINDQMADWALDCLRQMSVLGKPITMEKRFDANDRYYQNNVRPPGERSAHHHER